MSRANQVEAHQATLELEAKYSGLSASNGTTPFTGSEVDVSYNIAIYTVTTANIFVFGLINAIWMFHVMVSASKNLHNGMFAAIVRSPIAFFDNNPVGESVQCCSFILNFKGNWLICFFVPSLTIPCYSFIVAKYSFKFLFFTAGKNTTKCT